MFISEDFIDDKANDAATSPKNDLSEPSEKQKKYGNYKKGHISFKGINIAIENPKGSKRKGVDPDGNAWESTLHSHYGYVKGGVEGKDGDPVDVYVGPNHDSDIVCIINQANIKDGSFDEHKVALGYSTFPDAINGYLKNYDKDWERKGGIRSAYRITIDQFKNWLRNGNTKREFKGVL